MTDLDLLWVVVVVVGGGGTLMQTMKKGGQLREIIYFFNPCRCYLGQKISQTIQWKCPPNRSAPENLLSTTYTYVCHSRMNKWMNSTGIPSTNDRASDKVRSARFPLYPTIKWMKKVWMQYHNWGLEPIHPIDLLKYRALTFSLVNELITCMEMRKACWHDHRFVLEAV